MSRLVFLEQAGGVVPPNDPDRAAMALDDLRQAAAALDDAAAGRVVLGLCEDPAAAALLAGVFGNSPFLTRSILTEAAFLPRLFGAPADNTLAWLLQGLAVDLDAADGMDQVMRHLRVARRRVAILVALADIGGAWGTDRVTDALSDFADAAIGGAVRWLLRQLGGRGDLLLPDAARAEVGSGLAVLGMGKLGARELNYSSDVDLIVLFDQEVVPYAGKDSPQACFIRLVKDLVKLLQQPTGDGYVLRTDLRLRPDPGATPAVISMAAAEQYYESLGQNWERAAMIKARPVAGDLAAGAAYLERLRPFIWRRNLDYAAIEDIHSIKRQIHSHRGHADIAVEGHNIKLGRGGIRDIEFFAQTQQLIAGGRDPGLRAPATCDAIAALTEAGWITPPVAEEMVAAYDYLRRLEHRLQMIGDEQTQAMPKIADGVAHVANFMGHADLASFRDELLAHLDRVQRHYANLFETAPALSEGGNLVFTGTDDDPETLDTLEAMGFSGAQGVSATIRGWHHGRYRATRTSRSRELLTTLMPALLQAIASTANPNATLGRFDRFLNGLPSGVQLFSMLSARPQLLGQLAEIMGSAPRLANYLGENSGVLDAMIGDDFLAEQPSREELAGRLSGALAGSAVFEDVLDTTRRWVKERKFQLGVQILGATIDADGSGQAYAAMAEGAIAGLLPRVNDYFAEREGHGRIADGGMVVLAMGKLGSREMTAESDLDLIFLYDYGDGDGDGQSDGRRPLMGQQYFTRLSQRLINAITVPTAEGKLFEVDMRLRPSGKSGPVATRMSGFRDYQCDEAWTWEHMALARARVVAGPAELAARARSAIDEALRKPRDRAATARDVAEMRQRLAREKPHDNPWELKLVRGGLLDIEFIAQYLQLAHAAVRPEVLNPTTCAALSGMAEAGILDARVAEELIAASRLYRSLMAVFRVAVEGEFHPDEAPAGLAAVILRTAQTEDLATLERQLLTTQQRVLAHFAAIVEAAAEG